MTVNEAAAIAAAAAAALPAWSALGPNARRAQLNAGNCQVNFAESQSPLPHGWELSG